MTSQKGPWPNRPISEVATRISARPQAGEDWVLTFKGLRADGSLSLLPPEAGRFAKALPGDVVFTKQGHIAGWVLKKVGLVSDNTAGLDVASTLQVLRPSRDVHPRWLYHWLNSPNTFDTAQQLLGGRNSMSARLMDELTIPLPSLDEQRRIVAFLEDHLSRLAAADSYLATSLQRMAALRRSTLQAVVGAPDRPRGKLASAVLRLEAGKSFGGSAPPAHLDEWGIVKVSSMTWGAFRPEENKVINPSAAVRRYEIGPGDLLISRANTTAYVGAAVLVPSDVRPRLLLSDKSLRVVPKPGTSASWLRLALSTPAVRAQISAKASGTKDSMRNISQGALLDVSIPDVDQMTQATDLRRVADADDAVARLEDGARLAARRHATLRRALLTAAFTGRLTGRSSDMDIAEELAEATT